MDGFRRFVVMGPPGSGKSTLARAIGARFGVPVFHLDQAYFRPGWVVVPAEVFAAEVARVAALPGWVIDGNYIDTIGPRFAVADVVVYLDVPTWVMVLRVLRRTLVNYGKVRADAAAGCEELVSLGFLQFVWTFNRLRRQRNLKLVRGFPRLVLVVRDVREALRLLEGAASEVAPAPR